PNGQWLATGSDDATVRLWQVSTGKCLTVLHIPRPYENTNITGARGLSEVQRSALFTLGAVDRPPQDNIVDEPIASPD
ncbi:MAG: hypothetical protein AAFY26_07440, partial [Cyanobacteria bacterium J06638_22]